MATFADYGADPGLQALSIEIDAFDAVTTTEWVKSAVEPYHWNRIVSIAETTEAELHAGGIPGFSWVPAVIVDDEAIALEPPAHLRELVAR